MKYGYIRDARNNEDHLQNQRESLHRFNLDKIIREPRGIALGEGFQTLLDLLQPGDELYIDHVSRISRDQSKFLEILDVLIEKDITLYERGNLVAKEYMKKWLLKYEDHKEDEEDN
jgi:DNA invertase Pin-like site-specific DNA recombinase